MSPFKSIFNLLSKTNRSLFVGQWKSIQPIEKIKTNSNFSNWIEQTPSSRHLKLLIEKKEENLFAKVDIPIKRSGLEGYYFLYEGKLEITRK